MKLLIENGVLYVNNRNFCFAEKGKANGRANLEPGTCPVNTQFSHVHDRVFPLADGLGWIGSNPECDIVLGRVRKSDRLIPSHDDVSRLVFLIEEAEGRGESVTLEIAK